MRRLLPLLLLLAGCLDYSGEQSLFLPDGGLKHGGADEGSITDCEPETPDELCVSAGRDCGEFTRTDSCGRERRLDCGPCPWKRDVCGGMEPGKCYCPPATAVEVCAAASLECGTAHLKDPCSGRVVAWECGKCPGGAKCSGNQCKAR